MKYIFSVLLLHKAEREINKANVRQVLEAADIEVNDDILKVLIDSLKDVNIGEIIEAMKAVPQEIIEPPVEEEEEEVEEIEEQKDEEAYGLSKLFE